MGPVIDFFFFFFFFWGGGGAHIFARFAQISNTYARIRTSPENLAQHVSGGTSENSLHEY